MQRCYKTVIVAMVILAAWSIGRLQAQGEAGGAVFVSSQHAIFTDLPDGQGRVSMASLWGDANAGAHATFTKFAPGYDAGVHTHTNDVWVVVIRGAYLYKDGAGEKRVGAGDFLRVPGGHKHWSGGDKKDGALFYEESSGKFDLIPTK